VPDLTYYLTTRLLWSYLESDVSLDHSRLDMIRFIRVFKNSDETVLTKPGHAEKMGFGEDDGRKGEDWVGAEGEAEKVENAEKEQEVEMS
jgi:translation machinery-associated protein 16